MEKIYNLLVASTACLIAFGLVLASFGSGCSAEPFPNAVCTPSTQLALDAGVYTVFLGAFCGAIVIVWNLKDMAEELRNPTR